MFKCAILKPFRVCSLFLFKGQSFNVVSSVDSGVLTGVKKFLSRLQLGTLSPSMLKCFIVSIKFLVNKTIAKISNIVMISCQVFVVHFMRRSIERVICLKDTSICLNAPLCDQLY